MRRNDAAAVARLTTQLGYPTTREQSAHRVAALLDNPEQALFRVKISYRFHKQLRGQSARG